MESSVVSLRKILRMMRFVEAPNLRLISTAPVRRVPLISSRAACSLAYGPMPLHRSAGPARHMNCRGYSRSKWLSAGTALEDF
jgi:hypothetical protein